MHVPEGNVVPMLLIVDVEEMKPFEPRPFTKQVNDIGWSESERSMVEEVSSLN